MYFPIHIDTRGMGMSIVHFKWSWVEFFLNYDVFLSLKVVLILANNADPDEMQHYACHCLPKNPFRGFSYTKC